MQSDREILDRIRATIGRDPLVEFEGDICISLSLWDDRETFRGLIRHHDSAAQQRVLLEIAKLEGLRSLDIHQNWLRSLPKEMQRLKSLRVFNITSNYLGKLPDWIWGLTQLETLSVGVNDLEEISPRLVELVNLQHLYLHKNRIREFPRELQQLRKLRSLGLYLNAAPEFPAWITELPDIELFSWGISGITRFPFEIEGWKNLRYLSLICNQFDNVAGIERCKSLLGVRLHKNRIKKLPRDWSGMQRLRQVTLYQNELDDLPESMGEMGQLQMLNIAWNRFTHLPSCVRQIKNLRWLSVYHNDWVDESEFGTLPKSVEIVRQHPFGWLPPPKWNKLQFTEASMSA